MRDSELVMNRRQACIDIMYRVARSKGYTAKPNAHGDISCRSGGRNRGCIVVIPSEFSPGSLVPIATRHNGHVELETVRSAMCDALVAAGFLEIDS